MTASPERTRILWSTQDWVQALLDLPADGPLPARTVLVPNERVAHALRRELLRRGRADALAGTRFVGPLTAAKDVLVAADIPCSAGETRLRPTRIRTVLRKSPPLRYFDPQQLLSTPGWDDAFARTIGELERAGLRPEQLPVGKADDRWADVAAIWRALDDSAQDSWTAPRILAEAATRLARRPALWPYDGRTLVAAGGEASVVQARFLRAIPDATLALFGVRPLRERTVERLGDLFTRHAADAVRDAQPPRASKTERDLLAAYLFEPPERLADPERPRSRGRDGTVELEEHAGVESELEAAADWVARQVLEHGAPLESIALLLPSLDPSAGMLVQRLRRLPWTDGTFPVFVAGGLPLAAEAAGARALAILRALRSSLPAAQLAAVLPALRTAGTDDRHVSHGAAMDLVYSVGTVGGGFSRPAGALEWPAAMAVRERSLQELLARAREARQSGEQGGTARDLRALERVCNDLAAVREPVSALVDIDRLVLQGRPLPELGQALRAFLERWLLQPGPGTRIHTLLDGALEPFLADPLCSTLAGTEALAVLEQQLVSLRVPCGRFGEPAVYVGTVAGATGLPFAAVRVLGLAEGHFPSPEREDPVLSETERGPLAGRPDRALSQLQALDRVVRDTERQVVLSAPRLDVQRTERETSSLFIDAAAALGRAFELAAIRRDAFVPARADAERFRTKTPVAESAWEDRVATRGGGVPSTWLGEPDVDLARLRALAPRDGWSPSEGVLGKTCPTPPMPGLDPRRSTSASRLRTLLECPYRFLLQELLGFAEPAEAPSQRAIAPMPYGTLFHRTAQEFSREHGAEFGRREGRLEEWQAKAEGIADRVFDAFLGEYPLAGRAVRDQQRERLRRDFETWIAYDWDRGRKRGFVDVERSFGYPEPVELDAGGLSLRLRGFIDRIDVESGRTLLRDIKTGKARPRSGRLALPDPSLDVQLAIYGLVAERLAASWKLPAEVGVAYAYTTERTDKERAFREDFEALKSAARGWLAVAAGLMAERAFPRTPRAADCDYCPFRPVCGDDAQARAARLLASADGVLARFRDIKLPPGGSSS